MLGWLFKLIEGVEDKPAPEKKECICCSYAIDYEDKECTCQEPMEIDYGDGDKQYIDTWTGCENWDCSFCH